MKSETLSRYLGQPGLREQLAADEDSAVIGIAADPEDARRNCTVLYVPPEFSRSLLESVTLGGETVRVGSCGVNVAGRYAPTPPRRRLVR